MGKLTQVLTDAYRGKNTGKLCTVTLYQHFKNTEMLAGGRAFVLIIRLHRKIVQMYLEFISLISNHEIKSIKHVRRIVSLIRGRRP